MKRPYLCLSGSSCSVLWGAGTMEKPNIIIDEEGIDEKIEKCWMPNWLYLKDSNRSGINMTGRHRLSFSIVKRSTENNGTCRCQLCKIWRCAVCNWRRARLCTSSAHIAPLAIAVSVFVAYKMYHVLLLYTYSPFRKHGGRRVREITLCRQYVPSSLSLFFYRKCGGSLCSSQDGNWLVNDTKAKKMIRYPAKPHKYWKETTSVLFSKPTKIKSIWRDPRSYPVRGCAAPSLFQSECMLASGDRWSAQFYSIFPTDWMHNGAYCRQKQLFLLAYDIESVVQCWS